VPIGLRWIDVGCGNGAFTEVLIARCAPSAVSAVDPSEGQLSYARTRPGTKLVEFRVGDALALPYPDGSFDAAAMALAISFVPDPVKAATEMTRVVQPGGWVATYMWDLPGGGIPVEPMFRALKSLGIAVSVPGTIVRPEGKESGADPGRRHVLRQQPLIRTLLGRASDSAAPMLGSTITDAQAYEPQASTTEQERIVE
jgi:ubiquinone/menaquinone biosynthesis C-methylase UbiE